MGRTDEHWEWLTALTEREVRALLRSLPKELRERAQALPIAFERRPSRALVRDGVEPDTLGLFTGESLRDEQAGCALSPQITLYLDNLWEVAEGDEAVFGEEVRTTLLHELGHYLGLEEPDLEERDLE